MACGKEITSNTEVIAKTIKLKKMFGKFSNFEGLDKLYFMDGKGKNFNITELSVLT